MLRGIVQEEKSALESLEPFKGIDIGTGSVLSDQYEFNVHGQGSFATATQTCRDLSARLFVLPVGSKIDTIMTGLQITSLWVELSASRTGKLRDTFGHSPYLLIDDEKVIDSVEIQIATIPEGKGTIIRKDENGNFKYTLADVTEIHSVVCFTEKLFPNKEHDILKINELQTQFKKIGRAHV